MTVPLRFSGVLPFHFQTFVLHDLPKSEAFKFYKTRVEQLAFPYHSLFSTDQTIFDAIYGITGGRMSHIKSYLFEAGEEKLEIYESVLEGLSIFHRRFCCLLMTWLQIDRTVKILL